MMFFIVYVHTCTVTGKAYVGWCGPRKNDDSNVELTTSPDPHTYLMKRRWCEHLGAAHKMHERALPRAIRKHGPDAWEHDILYACDARPDAKDAETLLIATLDTKGPHGYNETAGGDGMPELSDEARERHRTATITAMADPTLRAHISATVKVAMARPETQERQRIAQREAQNREDVRQRRIERNARPEVRKQRSERMLIAHRRPDVQTRHRAACINASASIDRKPKHVQQVSLFGEVIATFVSIREASRTTGISRCSIRACVIHDPKSPRDSAGGFRWRYV